MYAFQIKWFYQLSQEFLFCASVCDNVDLDSPLLRHLYIATAYWTGDNGNIMGKR